MADKEKHIAGLSDSDAEFENALTAFSPKAAQTNSAKLMYLAGQQSVQTRQPSAARAAWFWPACTAAMTIVSATLGVALANRSDPKPIVKTEIRYISEPAPENDSPIAPPQPNDVAPDHPELVEDPLAELEPNAQIASLRRDTYLRTRAVALYQGIDAVRLSAPRRGKPAARSDSLMDLRGQFLLDDQNETPNRETPDGDNL